MNKRILLYAFTHDNFGDDLFIKILCERYPKDDFFIGLDPSKANDSLKTIKNLNFDKKLFKIDEKLKKESFINNHTKQNFNLILKIYTKYLKSFDCAIYIVGSAFIQNNPDKDYTNLCLLEKRVDSSNKFFLINSNFGPYFDERYLEYSKKIVRKMTHATFRDKFSYNLFKDIKTVSYAPDLVLTMKGIEISDTKQILVSVMELGDEYFNLIIKLIKEIYLNGFTCKLVSFCKSQNDDIIARKLINNLKDFNLELLSYNGNIDDILHEFNKTHSVIATRFHSMIISMALNKPFIPYIYSKKTNEVLDDINYEGIRISSDNLHNIDIKEAVSDLFKSAPLEINDYKQKAENQFKSLDIYLKE